MVLKYRRFVLSHYLLNKNEKLGLVARLNVRLAYNFFKHFPINWHYPVLVSFKKFFHKNSHLRWIMWYYFSTLLVIFKTLEVWLICTLLIVAATRSLTRVSLDLMLLTTLNPSAYIFVRNIIKFISTYGLNFVN